MTFTLNELTTDLNGCLELQKNRLINENVSGLNAQSADFSLSEVHLLARLASIFKS